MASDKMLGSFDQKSAPEDNDLLVEYDASASKVKNVKFGGVWNWIVKKLTSAVINELRTSSKNVVGAINELNSKMFSGNSVNAIDANDMITSGWYRCSNISNVPSAKFGYLLVFSLYQDSRYIFQLFQDANSSSLFRRVCVNSEWKDWIHM